MLKMTDLPLGGKRVLIREDLNVPSQNGQITSDKRIEAALPTIRFAVNHKAKVILMSHLGRPKEGEFDPEFSLSPVAKSLSAHLGQPVRLIRDWHGGVHVNDGEVVLLENIRFESGEKSNDETLSKKLASLCDVFVMDAFATAHRAQASTAGVAKWAKVACAGPLLVSELDTLRTALQQPAKPMVAIVGGSKVSSKLTVLSALSKKVERLIVGGGIANTFLAAAGYPIGKSLHEPDLIPEAKRLLAQAEFLLPTDVVVATEFSESAVATIKHLHEVTSADMILDIGPETAKNYADLLAEANTIVWNGPVGVFEWEAFSHGTETLARAIAHSNAYSIAGGGDTLAAVDKFDLAHEISYISTGGGAFLQYLEGEALPGVAALSSHKNNDQLESAVT